MSYYPVFLDLNGRRCVLIGGGTLAEGKVRGLLEAGAQVTVVSPHLTPELARLAEDGRIDHVARRYQPGDLARAVLAISTINHPAVNQLVWDEGSARRILVNVMDDVPHCNFIAPSIVRRGDLTVAISTSGKAPTLAVRLRQRLERDLGDEYARFLELAGEWRAPLAAHEPDFERRKAIWYELVDSDVLDLLRRGDDEGARRRVAEITGVEVARDSGHDEAAAANSGHRGRGAASPVASSIARASCHELPYPLEQVA